MGKDVDADGNKNCNNIKDCKDCSDCSNCTLPLPSLL